MHLQKIALAAFVLFTVATQAQQHAYPTRDPHTPGYVHATELPDATLPPANKDGNFILGPTHPPASESAVNPAVPQGTLTELTTSSADSKPYPRTRRTASWGPHRGGLRPEAIRTRLRRAFYRWSRRTRPLPVHRAR